MPARDGRVVEADVGGETAADARPALAERDDAKVVVLVEGEVVAVPFERPARLVEPAGRLAGRGPDRLADREVAEDGRPPEVLAAAMRACGNLVPLVQSHRETALLASKASGPGESSGGERLEWLSPEHVCE